MKLSISKDYLLTKNPQMWRQRPLLALSLTISMGFSLYFIWPQSSFPSAQGLNIYSFREISAVIGPISFVWICSIIWWTRRQVCYAPAFVNIRQCIIYKSMAIVLSIIVASPAVFAGAYFSISNVNLASSPSLSSAIALHHSSHSWCDPAQSKHVEGPVVRRVPRPPHLAPISDKEYEYLKALYSGQYNEALSALSIPLESAVIAEARARYQAAFDQRPSDFAVFGLRRDAEFDVGGTLDTRELSKAVSDDTVSHSQVVAFTRYACLRNSNSLAERIDSAADAQAFLNGSIGFHAVAIAMLAAILAGTLAAASALNRYNVNTPHDTDQEPWWTSPAWRERWALGLPEVTLKYGQIGLWAARPVVRLLAAATLALPFWLLSIIVGEEAIEPKPLYIFGFMVLSHFSIGRHRCLSIDMGGRLTILMIDVAVLSSAGFVAAYILSGVELSGFAFSITIAAIIGYLELCRDTMPTWSIVTGFLLALIAPISSFIYGDLSSIIMAGAGFVLLTLCGLNAIASSYNFEHPHAWIIACIAVIFSALLVISTQTYLEEDVIFAAKLIFAFLMSSVPIIWTINRATVCPNI